MLRFELRRAFINANFLVALAIGIGLLAIGLREYFIGYEHNLLVIAQGNPYAFVFRASDAVLSARSSPLVMYLAPLLVVLPFADSFTFDYHTNYIRQFLYRSTRWGYVASKLFANALAGGTVLALAHIIIFAVASILLPESMGAQMRIGISGPFREVYASNPALFTWLQIGIVFLFGATYATIGMFVSFLTDNRFIVLAVPFIMYIAATFVFAVLSLEQLLPIATFNPLPVTITSGLTVFGQLGLLFLVSVLGVTVASKRLLSNI